MVYDDAYCQAGQRYTKTQKNAKNDNARLQAEQTSYKKPPIIVANVAIVISLNEWGGYIIICVIKIVPKTARFYWEILVWWYLRRKEEAIKQVMIVWKCNGCFNILGAINISLFAAQSSVNHPNGPRLEDKFESKLF